MAPRRREVGSPLPRRQAGAAFVGRPVPGLRRGFSALALALLALGGGTALAAAPPDGDRYGVLVMAHGGSPEWNQAVLDAVEPLAANHPLEVAFGMADACSLQEGVRRLETQGVRSIGVVRLFISGESWYQRTEQILGLGGEGGGAAPPAASEAAAQCEVAGDAVVPAAAGGGEEAAREPRQAGGSRQGEGHAHAAHHRMAFFRIETESSFALSTEGLAEAPEMGSILADRARSLARDPQREDVLILAHGPGDDAENERWLAAIDARAAEVRAALPFHRVEVLTLREDWPEKRKGAEQRARAFVERAASEGRRALVIPFRLFGFGPYAEVLEELSYTADERGLLPHLAVTRWIARQAEELAAAPRRRAGASGRLATEPVDPAGAPDGRPVG
jgi:hypothetical protein